MKPSTPPIVTCAAVFGIVLVLCGVVFALWLTVGGGR